MADEEDYARLARREPDMVATDLTDAQVSGQNHAGTDFRNAKLERTTFVACDLSGCNFLGASYNSTKFLRCDLRATQFDGAIFAVDFSESDLRAARVRGLLHRCSFVNADLRGTDFTGTRLPELGTDFSGAKYNEQTEFDGVQALRAYSREPIFGAFNYSRGTFTRRPALQTVDASNALEAHSPAPTQPAFDLYENASIDLMIEVAEDAAALLESLPDQPRHGAIGHNNPPSEAPLEPATKAGLVAALRNLAAYAKGNAPDLPLARSALSTIKSAATELAKYVAQKADVAVNGFAEQVGASMASGRFLFGAYLVVTGKIDQVLAMAEHFLPIIIR